MKKIATILFIGFLLRILFINTSPPSLYGDELTITLDAYSLLKTGQDQLGNFLPLTFQMGAGRPAGYVYGSIPFIAIFGPTALGVRLLSILSGAGIIFLLYLIGRKLFSEKIGLIAAAIAAVSPWDISLSRGGFEAHFALFLAMLGVYLFIRAKENPMLYLLSALSFGATLHTYPTYKVSLFMFLPLLFWYQGKNIISKRYFLSGLVIFILIGLAALSQTFIGGSETRFAGINIFSQPQLKQAIEQKIILERQISTLPFIFAQYFHNKPVEYTKVFLENYLQNFSLDFLILHGDRAPRHNMATMGGIYPGQLILIFIAAFVFWQRQKRSIIFFVLWIFLAPVATAIIDSPHALRSAFMLPPLIILSSFGLVALLEERKRILLFILGLTFVIQFIFFVQKTYFLAPAEYSNFWAYPAKLASETALKNKDKYKYVILSDKIDSIEYAYPIYAKEEPKKIISQNKQKVMLGGFSFKNYGNVYIGHIPDSDAQKFTEKLGDSVLYIDTPDALKYLRNYEIINGLGNLKALVITKQGI